MQIIYLFLATFDEIILMMVIFIIAIVATLAFCVYYKIFIANRMSVERGLKIERTLKLENFKLQMLEGKLRVSKQLCERAIKDVFVILNDLIKAHQDK